MKNLAHRLIMTGADLSTMKALKNTLNYLGMKPDNIDKLYVELKNSMHDDRFRRIPTKSKVIFLPQCLRNAKTCTAILEPTGWQCQKCSGHTTCKVYRIQEKAEAKGYRVFVVPGGSMVFKLIKEIKPKAVIGVACMKELMMALEELKIPSRSILLSKDGCVNTDVKLTEVFSAL